jgi:hypothetical protein
MEQNEDMTSKLRRLINRVTGRAAEEAAGLEIAQKNRLVAGGTQAVAVGSITYFLGTHGSAFADGFTGAESPIYLAYFAVASLSVQTLLSICGRRAPKNILAGILTGATAGASPASVIMMVAFGLIGDVATFGAFTIGGGIVGYVLTRKGRKKHMCSQKLPCGTWVCPKCKRVIKPGDAWKTKDHWDVLDVCCYLDAGGLSWNVMRALAFLRFTGILDGNRQDDDGARWRPGTVRKLATDESVLNQFQRQWSQFLKANRVDNPDVDIEKLLLYWERDHKPLSPRPAV